MALVTPTNRFTFNFGPLKFEVLHFDSSVTINPTDHAFFNMTWPYYCFSRPSGDNAGLPNHPRLVQNDDGIPEIQNYKNAVEMLAGYSGPDAIIVGVGV